MVRLPLKDPSQIQICREARVGGATNLEHVTRKSRALGMFVM